MTSDKPRVGSKALRAFLGRGNKWSDPAECLATHIGMDLRDRDAELAEMKRRLDEAERIIEALVISKRELTEKEKAYALTITPTSLASLKEQSPKVRGAVATEYGVKLPPTERFEPPQPHRIGGKVQTHRVTGKPVRPHECKFPPGHNSRCTICDRDAP